MGLARVVGHLQVLSSHRYPTSPVPFRGPHVPHPKPLGCGCLVRSLSNADAPPLTPELSSLGEQTMWDSLLVQPPSISQQGDICSCLLLF